MKLNIERIKQMIDNGDISQDALGALSNAVPTESDYDRMISDAPEDMDSFKKIAERIRMMESKVGIERDDTSEDIVPNVKESKKVRFIDYDGTIINEIEAVDLHLEELPEAPDHSEDFVPLTFTGWTSTLETINSATHSLDVGAQYRATDGNTHLIVNISQDDVDYADYVFELTFKQLETEVTIDWGNGNSATVSAYEQESSPSVVTLETAFDSPGIYDICITTEAQDVELQCMVSKGLGAVTGLVIGNYVQSIGGVGSYIGSEQYAFMRSDSLQNLVIPDSVTTIGDYAFQYCSGLKCLVIPNSVTTIGTNAFEYCYSLQSLVIPDSVENIGSYVFYYCGSLRDIVLGDGLQILGSYVCYECAPLENLVLGNSLQTIGMCAFYRCVSLENLVIPDSVTTIKNSAFYFCYSLKSLVIPDSVISIEDYAFYYCESLQNLVLGNSLQTIGSNFVYCEHLKSLVIPDSVITIGGSAFKSCYSLKSLVLGNGLQSINNYAFQECYDMESLVLGDSLQDIGIFVFGFCYSLKNLVIPDSVTSIGTQAFEYCYALDSLVIGSGITTLAEYVFEYCYRLKNLVIPDNIKNIMTEAFRCCYSLQSLVLGDGLNTIGNYALEYSYRLQSLDLGNSVKEIGGGTFCYCNFLQSLVIPDSVTSISSDAFTYCNSLKNLMLGSGLQDIAMNVFKRIPSIRSLVIPNNVKIIAVGSFQYCQNLNHLVLGSGLNYIGYNAFQYSSSLNTVYVRATQNSINFSGTVFTNKEIIWGYKMSIVGFEITNSSVMYYGDGETIEVVPIYKCEEEMEEGETSFPVDVLDNITFECSDNATLENGVLKPLVDSGTVTVTAYANDGSGYSVTKELEIIAILISVNLNNGQWVDTGTEVNGHKVYKSNAGSYYVNSGISRCTLDVIGCSKLYIVAKAASGSEASSYDYVVLGNVGQTATRSSYKYKINQTSYTTSTYNLDRSVHSTIDIVYTKDSSVNSGEDRGYFYYYWE